MEKQKVMLVSNNLMSGGIETSMINFVDNMNELVDIDIFLCKNSGILKDRLNKNIKVIEGNKLIRFLSPTEGTLSTLQTSKIKNGIRKVLKFFYKLFNVKNILTSIGVLFTKKIKQEYDVAICYYAQKVICQKIALKKIKAKKKFAYIHADVSKYQMDKKALKLLNKFDKILCVSNSSADIFKQTYPHLKEKVEFLYNFQDCNKIIEMSNKFKIDYGEGFNIVSVSRLYDPSKALMRSLEVFHQLMLDGYDFTWHVIGDGPDRQKMEEFISQNNMQNCVKLYGNQQNPFPYVKSADLFYLGSYQESWGMVLIESMLLGVPVLTTRTSSVEEILQNRGFICENDKTSIYENLKYILQNKQIMHDKKKEIIDYTFDNNSNKMRCLNLFKG